NCDPVTVMEFKYPQPVADLLGEGFDGACKSFGRYRAGHFALVTGPFRRLGVSPDGSLVVFEVTNGSSILKYNFPTQPLPVSSEEEGIYVVRADGSGKPRKVAPPSEEPSVNGAKLADILFAGHPDRDLSFLMNPFFGFAPDGRTVVFTDRGPKPDGK